MAQRILLVGAAAIAAALIPFVALADGPQEITTATNHAGLASKAGEMAMVKTHLHHVLNCLVGANGQGFDASFGNPCNNQGAGAINDTADAATKAKLTAAAGKVRETIALNDADAAKKGATDIQGMLK